MSDSSSSSDESDDEVTPRVFTADNFNFVKVVGHGRFGKVWFAIEKESGFEVAIKKLEKSVIDQTDMHTQVFHEIFIHSKLFHPNIILFLTYFHDNDYIYLVHKFAENGCLFKMLQEQKYNRFDELTAAKFSRQTADALLYLHSHRYCHGDVKPENILVDRFMNVKLSDFGLSWPYATCSRDRGFCGTVEYLAPEVINHSYYDHTIDIWSVGVLIFELLTGKSPFHHNKEEVMKIRINKVDYKFPKYVNDDARDLVTRLLVYEPDQRMPLSDILTHEWIIRCLRTLIVESSREPLPGTSHDSAGTSLSSPGTSQG